MSDEPNLIPGTRVPDTAIHRASLWLEILKFGEHNGQIERMKEETLEGFVEAMPGGITMENLDEAARFYGANMLEMTLGGRVKFRVSTPAGVMSELEVFASLWMDAFMHGAATVAGKRGLSRKERETYGDLKIGQGPDGTLYVEGDGSA